MAKPVKFGGAKSSPKGGSTSFDFGHNNKKSKSGKRSAGGKGGGGGS